VIRDEKGDASNVVAKHSSDDLLYESYRGRRIKDTNRGKINERREAPKVEQNMTFERRRTRRMIVRRAME
jgi:hypothetical protein